MTIDESTSLIDVARAVCTALSEAGMTAVMTGGSAATYYAPDAYQSVDIDFVSVSFRGSPGESVEARLLELGFRRE